MITDLKKGITVRCRVPMQKMMKLEDGSTRLIMSYCNSTEWKFETEELIRKGDALLRQKVKTNRPLCANGHIQGLRYVPPKEAPILIRKEFGYDDIPPLTQGVQGVRFE